MNQNMKGRCSKCGVKGREHAAGRCGIVLNADGARRHSKRRKGHGRRHEGDSMSEVVVIPTATNAPKRGVAVAHVGGAKAKSARAGNKKAKVG